MGDVIVRPMLAREVLRDELASPTLRSHLVNEEMLVSRATTCTYVRACVRARLTGALVEAILVIFVSQELPAPLCCAAQRN